MIRKILNSRKTFLLALLSMCVSLMIVCVSITYAWFANNKYVDDNRLDLTATVSPNLIISDSATDIKTLVISSEAYSVILTDGADETKTPNKLYPCSRVDNKLKYVVNTSVIDYNTGLTSKTINYGEVDTNNKAMYYVEYVVYISAYEKEMTNYNLSVAISSFTRHEKANDNDDPTDEYSYQAASIDFLFGSLDDDGKLSYGNYIGTLNVAKLDITKNDGKSKQESLTIDLKNGYSNTIPLNTSTSGSYCIPIIMRYYFDGALIYHTYKAATGTVDSSITYYKDESGTELKTQPTAGADATSYYVIDGTYAYVNSNTVSNKNVKLDILFTAVSSN